MASPFLTGTLTVKIGRWATLAKRGPIRKAVASPWQRAEPPSSPVQPRAHQQIMATCQQAPVSALADKAVIGGKAPRAGIVLTRALAVRVAACSDTCQ